MKGMMIDGQKLPWHLDRVLDWREGKVVVPVYVEMSPTARCNHRCSFCGLDFARGAATLPTDLVVRRLREMGRLGVRSVMFAGEGEPLLHPGLPEMVRAARKAGIDVALTTNGSRGTASLWRKLLPDLSWVKFSIDAGTASVHSLVHGVAPGEFQKVCDGVRHAVAIRREACVATTIGVQYLLVEENVGDVGKAVRLFDSIGVDYLVVKPFSPHPKMVAARKTRFDAAAIREVESEIRAARRPGGMDVVFRKDAFRAARASRPSQRHCHALPFWGYVDSDGGFHTCSVFLGDDRFRVGNIRRQTMRRILLGPERAASVAFGAASLKVGEECRTNCRMARINEFLDAVIDQPMHVNFI